MPITKKQKLPPVDATLFMLSHFAGEATLAMFAKENEKKNTALHTFRILAVLMTQMQIERESRPFIAEQVEGWIRQVVQVDHDGILGDLSNATSIILSD
ncbi:MAG: hypothetical protein CMI52_04705 [Parcubacteria group bacterium]|nr:hypothetical protein [Parcubacteria group bacterium]